MEKFIILMWLCSAVTAIECKQIKTDRVKFIDEFDCTLYGYSHSTRLLRDFGREKVNQFNLYTKFLCISEGSGPKTET
tara:strand:+ start:168 stop:401 length:234 start_codon:yes stop_codon:yes gene_type:complete